MTEVVCKELQDIRNTKNVSHPRGDIEGMCQTGKVPSRLNLAVLNLEPFSVRCVVVVVANGHVPGDTFYHLLVEPSLTSLEHKLPSFG